jgi:AcrR family transcriptional regulator
MERERYHHGDLRRALVDEALKVLESQGVEALSVRALSERVGVSRAAPYRHFPDRDSLLAAVAARGFESLCTIYEAILQDDESAKIARNTRAMIDFAREQPGLYGVMFYTELLERDRPPAELIPPADRAFTLLLETVAADHPGLDQRGLKEKTVIGWSMTHGFITLLRANRLKSFMVAPLTEAEMVDAVVAAVGRI